MSFGHDDDVSRRRPSVVLLFARVRIQKCSKLGASLLADDGEISSFSEGMQKMFRRAHVDLGPDIAVRCKMYRT